MMAIWRKPPDAEPFNANDLNFLVGLSQQAAIAIETARLFQEVGRQKTYFESLVDISPVAVVTMDRDEVGVRLEPGGRAPVRVLRRRTRSAARSTRS